jgi:flagellar biosynthesis protein FliP
MKTILDLVKQAIDTGYLTREAEENLRRMLTNKYSDEDLDAFISLQQAAMKGQVRQESRETLVCQG